MYAEDLLMASIMHLPMHDVMIELMPMMMCVHVPAGGGSFEFDVMLDNMASMPATFDAWAKVRLPDGSWFGPVLGPATLTLPAAASVTRTRVQYVPGYAPNGNYIYRGYVGDYPGTRWDSSSFDFRKGGCEGESGTNITGWENTGEPFPGEPSQTAMIASRDELTVSPNPFNPTTALSFELRVASRVSLRVYDTAGREVANLVDGWREAGSHSVTFGGSGLPSGVYVCRLTSGGQTVVSKMVLMK
jgi:hypothetical protein